jgi:hypothetical protein
MPLKEVPIGVVQVKSFYRNLIDPQKAAPIAQG